MDITGHTKFIPLVGDPVEGVVSPPAINAKLAELGVDARMLPLHLPPGNRDAFWQLLRSSESLIGCSVTYPHKQAAFGVTDRKSDRARRLKAVNTLRRNPDGTFFGDATDGLALVKAIEEAGITLAGRSAHVIGAGGGAGRAIVDAFCDAGVCALRLSETCDERLHDTVRMVRSAWPDVSLTEAASIEVLVDATPNGKSANQARHFSNDQIAACELACDIAGPKASSEFLMRAALHGIPTIDAAEMGRKQVVAQLSVWLADQRESFA